MSLIQIFQSDSINDLEIYLNAFPTIDLVFDQVSQSDSQNFPILNDKPPIISVAAFFGAVKCFSFIQMRSDQIYSEDNRHRNVTHFACAGGSLDICDILDSISISFDGADSYGATCMNYACLSGRSDIVQRLWLRGIPLYTNNSEDMQPIVYALKATRTDALKFLMDKGICPSSAHLFIALESGSDEAVIELLKWGCNPSKAFKSGTPFFSAVCRAGKYNLAKKLIESRKVRVNEIDERGWTPLLYAADKGNLEVCKLLVEADADVNMRSIYGFTPAQSARNREHEDVCQYLMSMGGVLQGSAIYKPIL